MVSIKIMPLYPPCPFPFLSPFLTVYLCGYSGSTSYLILKFMFNSEVTMFSFETNCICFQDSGRKLEASFLILMCTPFPEEYALTLAGLSPRNCSVEQLSRATHLLSIEYFSKLPNSIQ